MIKAIAPMKEFVDKFSFRKCKGEYGEVGLYYKCISANVEVMFISEEGEVYIQEWDEADPRVHERPNFSCLDKKTAEDYLVIMSTHGMVEYSKY